MAIVFIIVGLAILTGYDKKIQILVPDRISAIDAKLINGNMKWESPLAPIVPVTKNTSTILKPDLNVARPFDAPEIPAGLKWINTNPLTMAELKGKVVIIDFWTYSCINCLRTLPYLTAWNEKYKDQGLVIIGVHAPEFAFEQEKKNVESAVKDHSIAYPVVLDNDFKIWKSYENQFWPAKYFIDKTGKVRSTHFGEGAYDESEKIIQYLLSEGMEDTSTIKTGTVTVTPVGKSGFNQNPETYLGLSRAENYTGSPGYNTNGEKTFTLASRLDKNQWSLGGIWGIENERIISKKDAILQMNVSGRDIYLVLGGKLWATARVSLNGQNASGKDVVNGILTINGQRLYHLVSEKTSFVEKTLKIEFDSGIEGYAFTFGG